jgi:hypothetical protein
MNSLEEAQQTMYDLIKKLELKINSLDENQSVRAKALEFASCMYINDNGNKGDTKAEGFIAFANEVYKYLKEGKSNA